MSDLNLLECRHATLDCDHQTVVPEMVKNQCNHFRPIFWGPLILYNSVILNLRCFHSVEFFIYIFMINGKRRTK